MKKTPCNFIHNGGGLGDCIARLPPLNYAIKHHPEIKPLIFVPDFFKELTRQSLPKMGKDAFQVFAFSEKDRYKKDVPCRVVDSPAHTNLSYHMTDHAFNMFVNKQVKNVHKDTLEVDVSGVDVSRFNLPERYIVITTGFTSNVRQFLPKTVNVIIEYLLSKNITPVFLGKTETNNGLNYIIKGRFVEEINYHKGINLIDKTSIMETTKILYGAITVVGIDNGLLHLASTKHSLPTIWGFTSVNPLHRVPYRNGGILGYNSFCVVPPEDVICRFNQSNLVYAFDHKSFTDCFYEPGKSGEDLNCLTALKPEMFIEEIEKVLSGKKWEPSDLKAELP